MGKYIHIQISGKINKVTGLRYRLRIIFKINARETGSIVHTRQRTKTKQITKIQQRNLKRGATRSQPKTGDDPGAREG